MLVAEPRDGKKAADVKAHMLSQMGRGKKNQMAEPNLADYQARKEHHHHEMLLITHDHDDKQQQHQDDEVLLETDGEEKTHPR